MEKRSSISIGNLQAFSDFILYLPDPDIIEPLLFHKYFPPHYTEACWLSLPNVYIPSTPNAQIIQMTNCGRHGGSCPHINYLVSRDPHLLSDRVILFSHCWSLSRLTRKFRFLVSGSWWSLKSHHWGTIRYSVYVQLLKPGEPTIEINTKQMYQQYI